MIRRREALLSMLVLPAVAGCQEQKQQQPTAQQKKFTIAVIPKGTTHEFWKSVHAGAEKAAQELGNITILWKGPLKEDDLKAQIDIVQSMIAQGVNGIILAPLNEKALVNPVKDAVAAKIPVVIVDSDLQGKDHVSFIATDNRGAGVHAAEHLGRVLNGKGKVIVLRYQEGSASTTAREAGFLGLMKGQFTQINVISDNQYGGATTESAFVAAENLLAAHKATEGGVDGVFCPNESTTFGMLLALQKAGLAGKVKLVGFDASEKLIQGVRDGHIDGLVVQNPFNMGDLSVRVLMSALSGQTPTPYMDTGSRVVTKADLENPEVKALLQPDLKKWLKE
ncbi:Ribose ABC transport system, periplasmic ribose-binding protein RbsB [Minicystis rosea]|nr:Ribose ABC transport system, periplasmic ribose-binding protein RbsB [Minicystis rosea]